MRYVKYARGIHGILLCADSWETQLEDLERAARRVLLRVCRGYKTIPKAAAQVIAGIPSVYLLAKERTEVETEKAHGWPERI